VWLGNISTEGGFTLALFQGWGVGSEVLLDQVQLNFSFRNKFIILPSCGLLVDNTFSKMCVFKRLNRNQNFGKQRKKNYGKIIEISASLAFLTLPMEQ